MAKRSGQYQRDIEARRKKILALRARRDAIRDSSELSDVAEGEAGVGDRRTFLLPPAPYDTSIKREVGEIYRAIYQDKSISIQGSL